jgi:murein DD-endopeptidase MepM/ murein hydrolase activator NlpD
MNPLTGKITSPFGKRIHPITKAVSFHNGVDIACPVGTVVVAPADGKIELIWHHELGGNSLSMIAKDGLRYGFAHLSKVVVEKDQTVEEGQIIALSGNTGRTTGPHLHFTVKRNGYWADPVTYFNFK